MFHGVTMEVQGLKEYIAACDRAGMDIDRLMRDELRYIAMPVRELAAQLLSKYDADSAAGLGITVQKVGRVDVEQRKRRVTGLRPDYGALQMRKALLPALSAKEGAVVKGFEDGVDRIAGRFEGA